jgi:hypothetical protein
MAQTQLFAGVVDCRIDQIAALLEGAAEGGLKEVKRFAARRRAYRADDAVVFKAERAGGVAKGGAGRRRGHAISRESPALGATGRMAEGSFLREKNVRMRRRM